MSRASHKFIEGELLFEFDEKQWGPLVPWDKHPAYRRGIQAAGRAKGVDFVGVYRGAVIFFIEVKNHQRFKRKKTVSPWVEFEHKVRDTIAGLVGSSRHDQYGDVCAPFVGALLSRRELRLVYWVELPRLPKNFAATKNRRLALAGFASRKTGSAVKWLGASSFIVSQEDEYKDRVPGLRVTNLPRKRRELSNSIVSRLQGRGIIIDGTARHHISQHLDLEDLTAWLERAATVSTVEEMFGGRR